MTWIEQRINQPSVAAPSTGKRSKKKVRATRTDYDTDLLHDPLPAPRVPKMPELDLWRAVLRQAFRDLSGTDKEQREAVEWVDAHCDEVGGFNWLCSLLGLDSGAVRGMVHRKEAP